jgi:hypothetical protein
MDACKKSFVDVQLLYLFAYLQKNMLHKWLTTERQTYLRALPEASFGCQSMCSNSRYMEIPNFFIFQIS